MNKILKTINENRQTVKDYSDKKINNEDWKSILESIYWSPTSHGFEPYRVLIINKDNKLREELKPMMWNQGVVTNSDKLIFFISLDEKTFKDKKWLMDRAMRRATIVAGLEGEKAKEAATNQVNAISDSHLNFESGDDWSMKQAYIALGNSMSAATVLGIGSTPMEGLMKNQVEELFRQNNLINKNERIAVAAAFGYASSEKAYAHWGTNKRVRDDWDVKFKEI